MSLEAFDVRQVWDSVLPGLRHIKDHYKPEWRPEDLYSACLAKRLHIFKPNAESSDFVLLGQNVSVYTGAASLLVLVAYSQEGDAVETYQSEIDEIARQSGCGLIDFFSPRIGWERHAKRHGYVPVTTMYRRNV